MVVVAGTVTHVTWKLKMVSHLTTVLIEYLVPGLRRGEGIWYWANTREEGRKS